MITYNNSVLKVGSSWLKTSLNPLGLPPYTMRFLFDAPFEHLGLHLLQHQLGSRHCCS